MAHVPTSRKDSPHNAVDFRRLSYFRYMFKNALFHGWLMFGVLLLLSSCTINKDIMFKTPDNFAFDNLGSITAGDYRIAANDFIEFQLYSNEGQRLLSITAGTLDGVEAMRLSNQGRQQTYWVRPDGKVELPEIGDVSLAGLTIQDAQSRLEEAYAEIYHAPFAMLNVVNNRVLVFPGDAGLARVITLQNVNTTVLEALALAGGISRRGNASVVKLIRTEGSDRKIYLMDLSNIEGMQAAATTVQAGDVIYVEPVPEIASEVLRDFSPYVSLLSTVSAVLVLIRSLNANGG